MRTMFNYCGCRRNTVSAIWSKLGDPEVFIDPFSGTASVLFGRPNLEWVGRTEIINDADPYIVNFFRSMRFAPHKIAALYDARLSICPEPTVLGELKVAIRSQYDQLKEDLKDPIYFSLALASQWYFLQVNAPWQKAMAGNRLPKLKRGKARANPVIRRLLNRCLIQRRLKNVEIVCGDWTSVLHRVETRRAAIFLDPPYDHVCRWATNRDLYAENSNKELAQEVAIWAVANASNNLSIALCGLDGDYDLPEGWESIHGGAQDGRHTQLDRIWFSPKT